MPIAVMHGDEDAVIPVDHARVLAQQFQALGRAVRYTEIAGGAHAAPMVLLKGELVEISRCPA